MVVSVHPELVCTVTVEDAPRSQMRLMLPHSLPTPALTAERCLVHDTVFTPTFALIINIVLTGVEGEAVDFLPAKYKGDTDRWTSSKSMVDHIYKENRKNDS